MLFKKMVKLNLEEKKKNFWNKSEVSIFKDNINIVSKLIKKEKE